MDEALATIETDSFGKLLAKDMGKAAALNAAAIVGIFGGLIVIGSVLEWRANRKLKTNVNPQDSEED